MPSHTPKKRKENLEKKRKAKRLARPVRGRSTSGSIKRK